MLIALVLWAGATAQAHDRRLYLTADPANSDLINPPKLLAGRIDLWAAAIRRGSDTLEKHGWAGKIVPVLVFKRVRVFLACNAAVPDSLIERLNSALHTLQRDGGARRIERHYDEAAKR